VLDEKLHPPVEAARFVRGYEPACPKCGGHGAKKEVEIAGS